MAYYSFLHHRITLHHIVSYHIMPQAEDAVDVGFLNGALGNIKAQDPSIGTKLCEFALDVLSVIRDAKGDDAVAGAVFSSGLDLEVLLPDDKKVCVYRHYICICVCICVCMSVSCVGVVVCFCV
jgi:hypothetical protein